MTKIESHIPEYTLEEKEEEIIVMIVAPLSKPKEVAFVLERNVFTFDSPPYLLKLKLPHPVCDRFSQQAYDSNSRTYKIKLKKNYEFLEEIPCDEDDGIFNSVSLSGAEGTVSNNTRDILQFYGFANKYTNMFGKLYYEFSEVISLPDPDHTKLNERRNLREKEENEKWSEDHYLADTMETDHLGSIFTYKPPWVLSPVKDDFNDNEKEMLVELLAKSKLDNLSEENVRLSKFQIIDILFSYAYNKRTTEGDNTVESGWTINKLSSTLSWFEVFEDLKSVILSSYRRSLIFPLYRNWKLAEMVHEDVVNILQKGSKWVTCCLLEVREIFNESENRYILNSLYINDLCNFAFHMSDKTYFDLAAAVKHVNIEKCEVNSDLRLLEMAAEWTLLEVTERSNENTERKISDIVDKIKDLNMDFHNSSESSGESESEYSDSAESSDEN